MDKDGWLGHLGFDQSERAIDRSVVSRRCANYVVAVLQGVEQGTDGFGRGRRERNDLRALLGQ